MCIFLGLTVKSFKNKQKKGIYCEPFITFRKYEYISGSKLKKIGITTPEELIQIGSKEAFREIKSFNNNITIEDLYAIHGAIENITIHSISENTKKLTYTSTYQHKNYLNM